MDSRVVSRLIFSLARALQRIGVPVLTTAASLMSAAETPTSTDHWAFRLPLKPSVPKVKNARWAQNPIDSFILAKLEEQDLKPSPPADRRTLIRRLSFGLIGLPPTPEEVEAFLRDNSPNAYERLVERLLGSPRYGESWARHWLDVVRFAESNGFETNTERKNAWPFRDYVIRAFNEDKPYDRFILEQLAGDAFGVDEATGFIVAGPWDEVKSPDINLTLQQRTDELHDMVNTTATAFLGLTVGCARCHDHKFDPIPQTDYYAMQAVFAGVQHGDRQLKTSDLERRRQEADDVRRLLAVVDRKLERFEPLAQVPQAGVIGTNSPANTNQFSRMRPPVHPKLNVERFAPTRAKFVRFTILETTDIEPCIDELEIFTVADAPRNMALANEGAKATASGTYPNSDLHKLEHINDGKYGNSRSWISNEKGKGWIQLELPEEALIDRIVWARDREEKFKDRLATKYKIEVAVGPEGWTLVAGSEDRRAFRAGTAPELGYTAEGLPSREADELKRLLGKKQTLETRLKPLSIVPQVYAGKFMQPEPTYRLYRGDPMQKREPVNPGGLSALHAVLEAGAPERRLPARRLPSASAFHAKLELPADTPERERRLALARWIADSRNPLTARVLMNRLWHYHFGHGLVSTPSDFGRMGAKPTHPELLDWLANELVASGWSIKAMHRLIVLSGTYRQASAPNDQALAGDAADSLLWRFPPRRLEAEALRDSILRVSGKLDLKMGGPGFDLFEPNSNYVKVYNSKKEFGAAEWRRMVYQAKPRNQLDDTFGAFDCPDAAQIAPRRTSSITPLQSLNLLNSPFLMQQAGFLAERLATEVSSNVQAQAKRAFQLAFSREPARAETDAAAKFIQEHGLVSFCRALLNANEFMFVF